MYVLHANVSRDQLWIWGEDARGLEQGEAGDASAARSDAAASAAASAGEGGETGSADSGGTAVAEATASAGPHPFAVDPARLREVLADVLDESATGSLTLRLPSVDGSPLASPPLEHWVGLAADDQAERAVVGGFVTPAVGVALLRAERVLTQLMDRAARSRRRTFEHDTHEPGADDDDPAGDPAIAVGDSVRFFATAAGLARSLMAEQRFVPMLVQSGGGELRARWRPWLSDEHTLERLDALLRSMPASARAVADEHEHAGWSVLASMLNGIVDAAARQAMEREEMSSALATRRASADDPHVAWLHGLLKPEDVVPAPAPSHAPMMRSVRHWIGGLEERGVSAEWRLLLRLNEPMLFDAPDPGETGASAAGQPGGVFGAPGDDVRWALTFHLQSVENSAVIIDAEDLWAMPGETATVDGLRIDQPRELLVSELARAVRFMPQLESALTEQDPSLIELPTREAYEFLREIGPILEEQGFGVESPSWWDTPAARIGGRLKIDTPDLEAVTGSSVSPGSAGAARLGLNALVSYEWSIAVGDKPLTLKEFEQLASQNSPLVRIDGKWIEIRPEDVKAAAEFIHANPGGEMKLGEAMRMAFAQGLGGGLPVLGVDATGWASTVLAGIEDRQMPVLDKPEGFRGELRPYQQRGLSWLAFLDSIGLGPCLADDMGLGKTIQLLALLVHEREEAQKRADAEGDPSLARLAPTLLVVPMSIVGNWVREAERFAPSLRVLVHHGTDRLTGEAFRAAVDESDIVVTTYALVNRDRDMVTGVEWGRVVLDEAQNIKNPGAKQTQAVRALEAERRITLTGTPLENRLSELWSIMDFCNPGLLGTAGEFRRAFSVPIERYRDRERSQRLRQMVQPFILRRLKTDPQVISDLPEKIEMKEFCRLTSEQANLYEATVKDMLSEVDRAEGIRRRGVVLTTLIRLKQICDHPALVSGSGGGNDEESGPVAIKSGRVDPARSGKCIRMLEMIDEVMSAGQRALIFTQFRQMGHLLSGMLRHAFDRDVLFLHGGVPQRQREKLVERFQSGDESAPVFILSLKAGGVGLNLTAASHVFHFDRWWNPAVENQATDRAFRIGQTKTVNVHKFLVGGTLEERIDQMIESKVALAEDIIGSGEDWLTELSASQLRDVLQLRPDALVDE